MGWVTPPILAEYVSDKLKRRYRNLREIHVDRPRLGIEQPRVLVMAAKDAPPPIPTKSPDDAQTSRGRSTEVPAP